MHHYFGRASAETSVKLNLVVPLRERLVLTVAVSARGGQDMTRQPAGKAITKDTCCLPSADEWDKSHGFKALVRNRNSQPRQ